MNRKSTAGVGFLFCSVVIIGLVLAHTSLWLFGEFAEGNHVAQDLHQAGLEPSRTDGATGFVVGGIPMVFFIMCLVPLAQAFRLQRHADSSDGEDLVNLIRSSSRYAIAGVLGLVAYPPILSWALSALGSLDTSLIMVSAAPHVMALAICSALFWLFARSIGIPKLAGPRSGRIGLVREQLGSDSHPPKTGSAL